LCPSGKKGGDLGEFRKGQMVKPFDDAVFKGPLLSVQGPVKTQFGFHLIKTLYRS
jgi:peptidyl-prolyl cis-trans isomerase C